MGSSVEEKLCRAIANDHMELCKEAIEARADPNARYEYEYEYESPLERCVHFNRAEIFKFLIDKKADIQHRVGEEGLLHRCAEKDSADVAKLLVEMEADVNEKGFDGWSPLHVSARAGSVDVARLLSQNGANLNAEDSKGRTPLSCGICSGHGRSMAQLLIGKGAFIGVRFFVYLIESVNKAETLNVLAKEKEYEDTEYGTYLRMLGPCAPATGYKQGSLLDQLLGREVPAARHTLVGLDELEPLDMVLSAIAGTSSDVALASTAVQAIVEWQWDKTWPMYGVSVVLAAVWVVAALLGAHDYRMGKTAPVGCLAAVWMSTLLAAVQELLELLQECWLRLKRGKKPSHILAREGALTHAEKAYLTLVTAIIHCLSPRNVTDLAVIALRAAAAAELTSDSHSPGGKVFVALYVAETWMGLLFSLRGLRPLGPRLMPIVHALSDTKIFFVVVAFALASATSAYWVMGARTEPSPFYAAFLAIFRLGVMGDFDTFELEGLDPVLKESEPGTFEPEDPLPGPDYAGIHLLLFSVSVMMTIVLMNLLIGILGQNYDIYEDLSEVLFTRERARLALSLRAATWPFQKLGYLRGKKEGKREVIMVWKRKDGSDPLELRSLREVISCKTKLQTAEIQHVKSELGGVKSKLGTVESELGKVEAELGGMRTDLADVRSLLLEMKSLRTAAP